jgi:hypothetical protein
MSAPINEADYGAIEAQHGAFCERHSDAAIALQNHAYALGLRRGVTMARANAAQASRLLRELVSAMDKVHWSSWQTTAGFADQLEAARAHILLSDQAASHG